MKSFAEFLSVRNPEMLVEFTQYAETMMNEAEAPAANPWWRKWSKKAMPWIAGATAGILGHGATTAHAQSPQDPAGQTSPGIEAVDDSVAAWDNGLGKFVNTSKKNAEQRGGKWFVKSDTTKDPLKQFEPQEPKEPQKNPREAGEKLNAVFAKYVYKLKKRTLEPAELDQIQNGKNDPYNTAYKIAHGDGKHPAYDEAVKFVQEVEKLKQEGNEQLGKQLGQKFANVWGGKVFGSKPR